MEFLGNQTLPKMPPARDRTAARIIASTVGFHQSYACLASLGFN